MTRDEVAERLEGILASIEEIAGGNTGRSIPISPAHDRIDAIAHGMNVVVSELRYAQENAERASRHQADFLRAVSHELRTPLTAILSLVDMLHLDIDPYERARALDRISTNAKALLWLINDLLDLAKVQAGKLEIISGPVSPDEIVSEVVESLSPAARAKGIVLHKWTHSGVPCRIISDGRRLRQILMNVVGNAVKFTQQGTVTVDVTLAEAGTQVAFEVRDTGIGISFDGRTNLFEAFGQAGTRPEERAEGAGLGLALSRSLAVRLGGLLELIDSRPGVGSVFRLTLPCIIAASQEKRPERQPVRLDGLRVLIAEDEVDIREPFEALLRIAGCEVTAVADGETAITSALEGSFDVVLMDVRMPGVDGITATQRLRARGYRGAIIALTAHVLPEERDRCLAAGCDGHMGKPIEYDELVRRLSSYLNGRVTNGSSS